MLIDARCDTQSIINKRQASMIIYNKIKIIPSFEILNWIEEKMRLGADPKLSDVKVQLQETYAPKKIVFAKWSYRFRKHPDVDISILGRNGDNNPRWTISSIRHRFYNIDKDDEKQPELDD